MNSLTEDQFNIIYNIICDMFKADKNSSFSENVIKKLDREDITRFVYDVYDEYVQDKTIYCDESFNVMFYENPILLPEEIEMYNKRILTEVFNVVF